MTTGRKIAVGVLVFFALVVAVRFLPIGWLSSFQEWVAGYGAWGVLIYALVYAVCTVAFIPGAILTLGAGAAFGFWRGSLAVFLGASVGSIVSFHLARGVLRSRIERWISGNAKFAALDKAIAKEGGKIVFLVRLAPVFPYNVVNYAFGVTAVSAKAYTVATVVGMIPGVLAYVYLGQATALAAQAASEGSEVGTTRLVVNVLGALAAIVVTILVARIATKAIREAGVDG